MQEKDTEAVNNQRRRRKRIGRIKNAIIFTIAGWILISMILIIVLLVRVGKLEKKVDALLEHTSEYNVAQEMQPEKNPETEALDDFDGSAGESEKDDIAVPPASGIDDAANLASQGDLHKVYLTFDDGPSENTEEILNILKEYDVKATFFVTGKEDEASQALYKRIVEEGHTLGMHSYSNKYSVIYESQEAFEEDYKKLRDYLFEVTGVEAKYYRFLGGSSNSVSNVPMSDFIHYLNGEGVIYYDWNVSSGDAASNAYSAEEIVANVTNDVVKYKTSVVLLHDADVNGTTAEALAPLIESLQNMGAEILPIDEDTSVIQYVKADTVE